MKKKDIPIGLLKVFWRSGGYDLAAVGQGPAGKKWIAPVNWSGSTPLADVSYLIEKVEVVCGDGDKK